MNQPDDQTSWRGSFVAALNVLAQAAARLPVGALDPELNGASAVELYTGGLWPTAAVELVCTDARPLLTELFTTGFRWLQRPRRVSRVLWHPELQLEVNLVEGGAACGIGERANTLVVTIDREPTGQAESGPLPLKVVGIEDLIVQQVGGWLRDGAASGEAEAKLQALVGVALEGAGGRLRAGYLQRRLAAETDGEVVFESLLEEEGGTLSPQLRRMSLTQMQALIGIWRDRCGLSVVPRSLRGRRRTNDARVRIAQREGECGASLRNVVALDDALPIPDD
jgi:hypothetical protein